MEYLIGLIKNTHGLKGGVIIKPLTDFDRFKKDEVVFCVVNEKTFELKIKEVNKTLKGIIVYFYNKENISLVEMFKGCYLYTNDHPNLEENEFHINDLIGKEVYNQKQKFLGLVSDVMVVPQGHILRVKTQNKEALIPFNDVFIKEVGETIIIEEIEGLI